MRTALRTLAALLPLAAAACHATSSDTASAPDRAALLGQWMTGAFSSAAQAADDPDFFEVRLVMVPIWEQRDDGPWLYVEQAVAAALDRPYRQRVYRLVNEPGGVRSEVFELPGDPLAVAAAWRVEHAFADVDPDDLILREGCAVHLEPAGSERWIGATKDDECRSDFRGASYATSEIELSPDRIVSWDRGFDAHGGQVWGAVKSGYVFERVAFPE